MRVSITINYVQVRVERLIGMVLCLESKLRSITHSTHPIVFIRAGDSNLNVVLEMLTIVNSETMESTSMAKSEAVDLNYIKLI